MSFAPIALRRDRVVEFVGLRETLALSPNSLIPKNRKRLGPQPTFRGAKGKIAATKHLSRSYRTALKVRLCKSGPHQICQCRKRALLSA